MGLLIQTFAGDSAPSETLNISRAGAGVVNLTGAKVWLIIEEPDTGLITNNPADGHNNQCTITDANNGIVVYSWNPGGTDCPDPGIYRANLKIKYGTGGIETYAVTISAGDPLAQIS